MGHKGEHSLANKYKGDLKDNECQAQVFGFRGGTKKEGSGIWLQRETTPIFLLQGQSYCGHKRAEHYSRNEILPELSE
jgi:hypothetical protein